MSNLILSNNRAEEYLNWNIYLFLEDDFNKYLEKHPDTVTADMLMPPFEDKDFLLCMDLANDEPEKAENIYRNWDLSDVIKYRTYKLIRNYNGGIES